MRTIQTNSSSGPGNARAARFPRSGCGDAASAGPDELTAAATCTDRPSSDQGEREAKIAECDRKLISYRAALDAGADPAVVARWITDTEAERARYQAAQPHHDRPSAETISPHTSPGWPTS